MSSLVKSRDCVYGEIYLAWIWRLVFYLGLHFAFIIPGLLGRFCMAGVWEYTLLVEYSLGQGLAYWDMLVIWIATNILLFSSGLYIRANGLLLFGAGCQAYSQSFS